MERDFRNKKKTYNLKSTKLNQVGKIFTMFLGFLYMKIIK